MFVALCLAAVPALAANNTDQFLKKEIQADNAEIMMGKLAENNGGTAGVRDFGQKLRMDHATAKQQMLNLAIRRHQVPPPPGLTPDAQAAYRRLSGMTGTEFDRAFLKQMVADHKKTIAAFEAVANAKNGQVSALAAHQLPVLRKHLAMAQALQKNPQQNPISH